MYNEDVKRLFINQLDVSDTSKLYVQRLFEITEEFERKYNKDLCQLDVDVLNEEMSKWNNVKTSSAGLMKYVLNKYEKWCIDNNISGAKSELSKVELDLVKGVRNNLVSSPLHLQKVMDEIFYPVDKHTMDNVYRMFYWMAYMGIKMEDTAKIKIGDVNLSNTSIQYDGESYPIYRESMPALMSCMSQEWFLVIHPRFGEYQKNRVNSDLLLRGVKSDPNVVTMKAVVNKRVKSCDKDIPSIAYERLADSGMFYRTYEIEMADCDAQDYIFRLASYYVKANIKSFDATHTERSMAKTIAKKITKDYNNWKEAFK